MCGDIWAFFERFCQGNCLFNSICQVFIACLWCSFKLQNHLPIKFLSLRLSSWHIPDSFYFCELSAAESLCVQIQVVDYCYTESHKITCNASVIFVPILYDIWCLQELDQWDLPIPYIATARGLPCVVPPIGFRTMLLTYIFGGCSNELTSAYFSARQRTSAFFRANSPWSKLKAFTASISCMASFSVFPNSFLKLWIAYSIPHFWPKKNWKFFVQYYRNWFYTMDDYTAI